jgi:hypothetical protein
MSRFLDALGTVFSKFQLGIGGPFVKGNSGAVEARNPGDTDYADIHAALGKFFGNSIELNAGAGEGGDDWKMTLSRPDTGMTEDIEVVMPPDPPTPGQVLAVESFASGVVTLEWAAAGTTADCVKCDTTTLAVGDASPKAMFNLPANNVLFKQQVVIDSPFDGAPSVSIGTADTPSKYMGATQIDLTAAAGTIFEVDPGLAAPDALEALIATYAAGGATMGSARLLSFYGEPD